MGHDDHRKGPLTGAVCITSGDEGSWKRVDDTNFAYSEFLLSTLDMVKF